MRVIVLIMIGVVAFSFFAVAYGQDAKGDAGEKMSEEQKKWLQQIKEEAQKREANIEFYGVVFDQNGNSVSGAVVEVHIKHFTLAPEALGFAGVKDMTVTTDEQGRFQLKGVKGWNIYIYKIERAGYEYRIEQNSNNSFAYSLDAGFGKFIVPDKTHPIEFHLRKKGNTAFLVEALYLNLGYGAFRDVPIGYDAIKKVRQRNNLLTFNDESVTFDLLLSGTFDAVTQEWTVMLAPGNKGGGIIVSDKMLYDAPKDGYLPRCSLVLPCAEVPKERRPELQDGWLVGKHIYLKSREPSIYSRFSITHSRADKDGFSFFCRAATNPYGERCLDEATGISGEDYIRLGKDVRQAFRAGRRPAKPDFKKMVEEAEKQKTER